MTGDCHIRFCERLRVKLPLPTRRQTVNNKKDIRTYCDNMKRWKTISGHEIIQIKTEA